MNLAVGALASISELEYLKLLKKFKACPSIQEIVDNVNQMDLNLPRLSSSEDKKDTLKKLSGIFTEIAPAWEECPGVKDSNKAPIK